MFVAGFIGSPAMNFLEADAAAGKDGAIISVGPTPLITLAGQRLPSKIIVGIRPERVVLSPEGTVPARVDLIETTGLGTVVHLMLGGQQFKLFTTDRPVIAAGETVKLRVDAKDLRLFDPSTGVRIKIT